MYRRVLLLLLLCCTHTVYTGWIVFYYYSYILQRACGPIIRRILYIYTQTHWLRGWRVYGPGVILVGERCLWPLL